MAKTSEWLIAISSGLMSQYFILFTLSLVLNNLS